MLQRISCSLTNVITVSSRMPRVTSGEKLWSRRPLTTGAVLTEHICSELTTALSECCLTVLPAGSVLLTVRTNLDAEPEELFSIV